MLHRLLALIALCLAPSAQATDVYKWIDAGGVVHYADTEPPAEAKAQMLRVSAGKASAAAATEATAAGSDTQGAAAGRSKSVAADAILTGSALTDARCARARSELELLQSATPVALASGDAKQPLDGAGRRAQIENAQAVIARDCH